MLSKEYCDSMGLDYANSGGKGDCTISEGQKIVEDIFGKTVTRTFKRNTEAMIKDCSSNVFSAKCASGIGTDLGTLDEISLNVIDEEFKGFVDKMKKNCNGNIYASTSSFGKCAESMLPNLYISEQGFKFAKGMFDGALGWTHIPALMGKATTIVTKYGTKTLKYLFIGGEDFINSVDVAGDAVISALDNAGPVGQITAGICKNVVAFGRQMAVIIANVAQESIHVFTQVIAPVAFHVFHAFISAALHPAELLKNVAADAENFFINPVESLGKAITALGSIGKKVLKAVKMVLTYLTGIISQVVGKLVDDLKNMIDVIGETFKNIGDDIKDEAEAVGNALKHLF
jgi:hypothetical protein